MDPKMYLVKTNLSIMVLFVALLSFLVSVDATRSDYVNTISPHANTHWGHWGSMDWCPEGKYAYGFQLKNEGYQGRGDDTAINGIRLHCKSFCGSHNGDITSTVMDWGNWGSSQYCPGQRFLRGVSMRSEPNQGGGDDTAVNNFKFRCESPITWHPTNELTGNAMVWGGWSSPVHCPKGSYICGIRTKVEGYQRRGDDTALNAARFYCCTLGSMTC